MSGEPGRTLRPVLAMLLTFALTATACGDSSSDETGGDGTQSGDDADDSAQSDDDGSDDTQSDDDGSDAQSDDEDDGSDEPEVIENTDSWRGVTTDTISLGMSMLNFQILKDLNLSPNGWGDQQAVWEALIDDLNESGGVNGRLVEAVYEFYSPIDGADADRACSALTEDNEIFANIGGFLGPLAGTSDPCIVGRNETTLIGGEITNSELAQARAPWFTSTSSVEFQTINLLNLIEQTGRSDGAKVFTIGGAAAAEQEEFLLSELEDRGIEVVGSAIIEAPDGDTIAQDQELAVAYERFVAAGANTALIFGTPSAMIRGAGLAGLTGEIAIWSNDSAGLANLGATIADKTIANGALTATGPTDTEIWNDAAFQSECVTPVRERVTDHDLKDPATHSAGEENWFMPVRRYCLMLSLFVQIATVAGGDLNPTTFEAAALSGSFDDFVLPGIGPASLSAEKLGASDAVRLTEYDASIGDGDLAPVTELLDAFP